MSIDIRPKENLGLIVSYIGTSADVYADNEADEAEYRCALLRQPTIGASNG